MEVVQSASRTPNSQTGSHWSAFVRQLSSKSPLVPGSSLLNQSDQTGAVAGDAVGDAVPPVSGPGAPRSGGMVCPKVVQTSIATETYMLKPVLLCG